MRRRRWDWWSFACLVTAFVCFCGALYAYGQPLSQDVTNAIVDYQIRTLTERTARLETAAAWIAGLLIANLSAHLFQIYGERQRRQNR